jgi:hypothetical protein
MAGADLTDLDGFFVLISDYLCNPRHQCAILLHHRFQKLPGQHPVIPVFNNPLAASFSHGQNLFSAISLLYPDWTDLF